MNHRPFNFVWLPSTIKAAYYVLSNILTAKILYEENGSSCFYLQESLLYPSFWLSFLYLCTIRSYQSMATTAVSRPNV